MTAARNSIDSHQVMVVLGRPDDSLIAGLRSVGLVPVAEDGEVVVWGRRLQPLPAPTPPPPPETQETKPASLLMTIADAATALGLGRSTVYELIGRRQLEVVHIGRSARVPTEALRALVERLRADQADNDWRRKAG